MHHACLHGLAACMCVVCAIRVCEQDHTTLQAATQYRQPWSGRPSARMSRPGPDQSVAWRTIMRQSAFHALRFHHMTYDMLHAP